MKLKQISTKTRYLSATIAGVVMVLLGTYLFIDAYIQKDNFKIFMRGLSLLTWTVLAITYAVLYRKEPRSGSI